MSPSVALVVRSNREGVARLPRALRAAGFLVSLFAPPGSFASATVHRDAFYPTRSSTVRLVRCLQLLRFLLRLHRSAPRMTLPGGEPALHYLGCLDEFLKRSILGRIFPRATVAIRAGLPARTQFRELLSRSFVAGLAERCGVPVPAWAPIGDTAGVQNLARESGYPLIVKTDGSAAGLGVALCHDDGELAAATASDKDEGIVQAFLPGATAMQAAVALNGRLLDTVGWLKERCHPEPFGPSAVVVRIDDAMMAQAARQFAEETLFNGFYSLDFVVGDGPPKLIEVNPRPTPVCHLGGLSHALCLALGGMPPRAAPMPPERLAVFPQEIRRNPSSADDPELVHDMPSDDPELLQTICDAYLDGRIPSVRRKLEN